MIGEEVSEKLDIEPARMTVLRYRRKKYACRACEGEVQAAPLPAQVIEQGLATPGLLAHVAMQKSCVHMPLARQSKFFDRHGIELPRSTLTDWMLALSVVTQPLIEARERAAQDRRHPGQRRHADAVAERARRQDNYRAAVGLARRDRR